MISMNFFFTGKRMLEFEDNFQIHHNPFLCSKCWETNKTDDHKIIDARGSEIFEEIEVFLCNKLYGKACK